MEEFSGGTNQYDRETAATRNLCEAWRCMNEDAALDDERKSARFKESNSPSNALMNSAAGAKKLFDAVLYCSGHNDAGAV
jgi:hypothetical protein